MTSRRNPSKLSEPDVPASTAVVTPRAMQVLIEVYAPVRNAGEPVRVQVDQPRRDELASHWNGAVGIARIDVRRDRRNSSTRERDVGDRVE